MGGALIVVGEDYGEGASVIQERTHAFALKSALWLMDPRPNLPSIVRMVEKGFELSEASHAGDDELRIRTCHVRGSFTASDNIAPAISSRHLQQQAAPFSYDRLSHPPATFRHEKLKYDVRMPAARKFIEEEGLNEFFDGRHDDVGLIVQGGLYNTTIRALQQAGLANSAGNTQIPLMVLNVVYPLVPGQIERFCAGKRAVMVIEGRPARIHRAGHCHAAAPRRPATRLHGKDLLIMGGEYTAEVILKGLVAFVGEHAPHIDTTAGRQYGTELATVRAQAAAELGGMVPARPPNFCTGCPERPVFAALKLVEREVGKLHISTDIGCHSFATFEPFSFGNSILGYGMSMASSAAVKNFSAKRPWPSWATAASGITACSQACRRPAEQGRRRAGHHEERLHVGHRHTRDHVHAAVGSQARGRGVQRHRRRNDDRKHAQGHGREVAQDRAQLPREQGPRCAEEAIESPFKGLKVVIAEGECQLERQRRLKPIRARRLKEGLRTVRTRYGVDEDTCTGDHSCIRLSGLPDAHGQAVHRPAQARAGGACDQRLRGLWPVRRGGRRRRAVPELSQD